MKILIDGDVVLYLAVATAESDTLESAAVRYMGIITDICESHFCDTSAAEIYLSGDGNFRKVHYPIYKSNRKAKNELINPLKHWVVKHGEGILVEGMEADDALLIRAVELGSDWSIATVDKDLRTHPGRFYDIRKQQHKVVRPGDAYTFMIQQFVMGDSVDGIAGLRGWGPKKTERLIHDGQTIWENFQMAKEIWEVNYGKGWEEAFDETCDLAFIRRRTEDAKPLEWSGVSSEEELRARLRLCV